MPEDFVIRNWGDLATYGGLPLILIGLAFTYQQLRHGIKKFKDETLRRRQEYALEFSLTKNGAHINARRDLAIIFAPTTLKSGRIPRADIERNIAEDSAVLSNIRLLLNHWENMALAIHNDVADEETALEMVGVRVVNTALQYSGYIEMRLEENPHSFKYLIWLAQRWNQRKKVHKRIFSKGVKSSLKTR